MFTSSPSHQSSNLDGAPAIGRVAVDSARHAAKTIVRRLDGDAAERPFRYRDRGEMATISRFEAVGTAGPVRVSGFAGWVLWLFLHAPGRTDRVQEPPLRAREWTISFFQNARFAALGMTP